MIFGRAIGWALLVLAVVVLGVNAVDLWQFSHDPRAGSFWNWFHITTVGELWFRLDPSSLEVAQPAIQRHVLPELWDPVILFVLLQPAAAVLAVPGLFSLLLCRRRRRPS